MLCPENCASPWFAASCCRGGALAVIQPLWVQETLGVPPMSEGVATTDTGAHPTSNASTAVGKNCSTAHRSQSSPNGSGHPHLAGDVHSPVRACGLLVPPLVILLPCWSVVIATSRTGVSTKTGSATGRASWTSAGFSESTSSWPCTKHVTVEPASIGYEVSELCKKCKKTGQW